MVEHEYTVALSVSGPGLDLDALTRDLGLEPFRADPGPHPVWMYDGANGKGWASLEDGLNRLLDDLEPRKDALDAYAGYRRALWCGHFLSSFGGGPTFSAELLRRLAAMGIPLALDTYFRSDDG